MLRLGDVFRLILFGNFMAETVLGQYASVDARRHFNEAFGQLQYSASLPASAYYSNGFQQQRLSYRQKQQQQQYYPQQQLQYGQRQAPLLVPQQLPIQQLPLVPSASLFPGAQSSALLGQSQTVLTPDITHQRLTGSLFKNYGNKRVTRVNLNNNDDNNNNSDENNDNNNNDNDNDDDNNGNNNNNKNDNNSEENSVEQSGEWVFDPNSRRVASNEWEFSGARRHALASAEAPAPAGPGPGPRRALCLSPGCRTWITISIPDRSSSTVEGAISTTYETKTGRKTPTDTAGGSAGPVDGPEGSESGKGGAKSRPGAPAPTDAPSATSARPKITTATPSAATAPPTRRLPSEFVFSTSWVLSLKRVTVPAGPSGTTTTTAASPESSSAGVDLVRPFTLKPKSASPSAAAVTSATSGPAVDGVRPAAETGPSGTPKKKAKPWTHSSASGASRPTRKKGQPAKHRPASPSPSDGGASTIEEAAIWASTELIDAIREALEKFRAALYRSGANVHYADGGADDAAARDALEQTFEQFKRGSWLERTLADAVLNDASLITDPAGGSANGGEPAAALLNAILPRLLTKLEDDPPRHGLADLIAAPRRRRRDAPAAKTRKKSARKLAARRKFRKIRAPKRMAPPRTKKAPAARKKTPPPAANLIFAS